jgi:hypothetical protein
MTMPKPRLKLIDDEPVERVLGSRRFISLTRNPALASPRRFEPTTKQPNDIVI